MNEAIAIERIEELISQSQPEEPPKLYPLDQTELTVAIQVSGRDLTLWHKLRKPTLAELVERDQQTPFETEEVSSSEDRLNVDDEGPNGRLWDKIALSVKGYRGDGLAVNEWGAVTPSVIAMIPAGHKSAAIRGLYQTQFEIERDEEEGFALGANTFTIRQTFGEYVIRHVFRAPTEAERREFRRSANETRFARGSRKIRTKVLTNLKAYVELYDSLFVAIDRATINGAMFIDRGQVAAFLQAIDPVWKRGAVDCLMRSFEASLSD